MDEVSKIIKEAIENTIGGNAYQHDKVNHWTKTVVDNCLGVLTKLQKPYKYIGKKRIFLRFKYSILIHSNYFSYLHDHAEKWCRITYS